MEITSEDPADMLENQILARVDSKDRSEMQCLLRNVSLFIKRTQGQPLSEEEKNYPAHALFSHAEQEGGQNTADILLYRLRLIDTYQLEKSRYIVDMLTETLPIREEQPLSTRKAQILWQLHQNPVIPKYKLAKKVGTTPRTVSKDLAELKRDYALRIFFSPDPHKFQLIIKIIVFKTKSILHTKQLENYVINHHGFLRTFRLDQDLRQGTIIFRFPNQPEAHKMFNERAQWLHDEFFTESLAIQLLGLHQFISFEMYDPTTNAYSIEPEIVSQVPFDYRIDLLDALPQPRGIDYTRPFWFDQADFLLADSLFATGPLSKSEHKQHLLQIHGIKYSKKTIWKKEQRLQKEKAVFPMMELRIPGFDEDLFFIIFCSPKASSLIRAISAFLPYVMVLNTDSGCVLRIQRPVHTSSLIAQLIRKIHHQRGVIDVKLLRYQRSFQMPLFRSIANHWNAEEQKWLIQEGDI
jgi:hypothetical protein